MTPEPILINEHIKSLLHKIFGINDDGDYFARTSSTGTFIPAGMQSFDYKCFDLTDEEVILKTNIINRKSMTIFNLSPTVTIFWGKTGVEAHNNVGVLGGIPIFPNSTSNIDFSGDVEIYAIVETGKTARVKIAEYA